MDTLNAIHEKMLKALAQVGGRIDAIFFCPHTSADNCACRKPKPGMLIEISNRFNTNLSGVPAIGDALRDLQAAVAVGAKPMLVLTGKGKKTAIDPELPAGTLIFPDLAAAVAHLLA
jgi:D-glycero-D-manno-heptose 1,7-bisphosphate phosphatase